MSEHHHRYHSAPATDEYRANFDRIFRRDGCDYSEAARKQRDALVQSARASAEAEKTCARVMNQAFGSDAERRKHFDPVTGFALPGGYTAYPDGQNSVRVVGPGHGVFGQDGT